MEPAGASTAGPARSSAKLFSRSFRRFSKRAHVPGKPPGDKAAEGPAAQAPDIVSLHLRFGCGFGVQSVAVAVLPGGDRLLTASADGIVRMSAVADGTLLWKVCAPPVNADASGNIMTTGKCDWGERSLRRKQYVTMALLNADVLVAGSGCLRSWRVEDGSVLAELQIYRSGVCALARLDDYRFVAGCGNGALVFCGHNRRSPRMFYEFARGDAHSACINDISVFGKLMATASDDKTAAVWDTVTYARIALLTGHTSRVDSVALSETMVVTGSSGTHCVCLYSAKNNYARLGNISSVGSVHTAPVLSVQVLDNEHIMTVSVDNTVAILSIELDKVLTCVQFDFDLSCIATLPSGHVAAFGADGRAVIARLPTSVSREVLEGLGTKTRMESLAAEAEYLSERNKAGLEALQEPELWMPEVTLTSKAGNSRVKCIEVFPDGDSVATLHENGMLRAWSALSGVLLWEVKAHKGAIGRRALAMFGREIVASGGYADSSVRTWTSSHGKARGALDVKRGGVFVIERLGSWRFVLGCGSGKIVVCKHEVGGRLLTMMYEVSSHDAHTAIVTDLSVSGRRLASSSIDKTVAVWDTETCSKLATLRGHTDWALCVDMSDSMIVSGSRGAPFVRVYDIARGYLCVSSFGAVSWVHSDAVTSLYILDRDLVLSASGQTFCVSGLQLDKVVARSNLSSAILSFSVLPSGCVAAAVQDGNGNADILLAPQDASEILRNFGAARSRDVLAASALALMAAGICENVRAEIDAAERRRIVFSDATNFDTCMTFLTHCQQWRTTAGKNARISVAFHGTPSDNMAPIIENSLRVPDGVDVKIRNGHSLGKGIYVSAKPEVAFKYSRNKPIFACLIITGVLRRGNSSCTPQEQRCDTFYGAIGDTAIFALQSSSQVS